MLEEYEKYESTFSAWQLMDIYRGPITDSDIFDDSSILLNLSTDSLSSKLNLLLFSNILLNTLANFYL